LTSARKSMDQSLTLRGLRRT